MLGCISRKNAIWYLSPTGQYDHVNPDIIRQQCGIVLGWVDAINPVKCPTPCDAEDIAARLVDHYGYPSDCINEGCIAENGVYNSPFPGDPPLHPLISTVFCGVKINIYEYDFVGVGGRLYRFT